MSEYCVFYNSDEDQLYITARGHTAWTCMGKRSEVVISTLFCPDCNYWHYVGEL